MLMFSFIAFGLKQAFTLVKNQTYSMVSKTKRLPEHLYDLELHHAHLETYKMQIEVIKTHRLA